jgi:hypothetical protein
MSEGVIRGYAQLRAYTGLSKTEARRQIAAGKLEPPFALTAGGKAKCWMREWGDAYNAKRIAARDEALAQKAKPPAKPKPKKHVRSIGVKTTILFWVILPIAQMLVFPLNLAA